jgi:chorismate synthase
MSGNSFGKNFVVTTFGESHGPALGGIVDGCPPGLELTAADLQHDLDRRKPGQSRHTTQRRESDRVEILSGVFEGRTTGTPIGLLIHNEDQRSHDYSEIAERYRPGHADYSYEQKYGVRDYRGGGRSSDIVARIALKPTSSIRLPGQSIDRHGAAVEVVTKGRHDPCVGIRATPIAEAMLALVLMDHHLRHRAQNAEVVPPIPAIPAEPRP